MLSNNSSSTGHSYHTKQSSYRQYTHLHKLILKKTSVLVVFFQRTPDVQVFSDKLALDQLCPHCLIVVVVTLQVGVMEAVVLRAERAGVLRK